MAKKLGIKVRKIGNADLEKAKKILSKGEPLSKIVILKIPKWLLVGIEKERLVKDMKLFTAMKFLELANED